MENNKSILISGFDPFGGEKVNPAFEAVLRLPESISSVRLVKIQVPTIFHLSIQTAIRAMEGFQPVAWVGVGLAGGQAGIRIERIAINTDDARLPDNAGNQPVDQLIDPAGPAAYFSTLPIKSIVGTLIDNKIPASISNSAGTFVCNHLMYGVLHYIDQHKLPMKAGFIHVPYLPEQVISKPEGTPSMDLDVITKGLSLAIKSIIASWKE